MHRQVMLRSSCSVYKHTESKIDFGFSYFSEILLRFTDKSTDDQINSENLYLF